MGNGQSLVQDRSIFNDKGSFYDAYKDPNVLQALKDKYERMVREEKEREREREGDGNGRTKREWGIKNG